MNVYKKADPNYTGIMVAVDKYIEEKSHSTYPDYWRGSSAGYCMRKVMFDRMGIPEVKTNDRRNRVFEAGHIFHEWLQRITKETGLSLSQEEEIIDLDIGVVGHYDDLVQIGGELILYDYKTQSSRAFWWDKKSKAPMKHTHRMQLGTYLYMLRKRYPGLKEGRILKISKDDLTTSEEVLIYTPELEKEILDYWTKLDKFWEDRLMPPCTCHTHDDGFMAKEKSNPYFYNGEPCSMEWFNKHKGER